MFAKRKKINSCAVPSPPLLEVKVNIINNKAYITRCVPEVDKSCDPSLYTLPNLLASGVNLQPVDCTLISPSDNSLYNVASYISDSNNVSDNNK